MLRPARIRFLRFGTLTLALGLFTTNAAAQQNAWPPALERIETDSKREQRILANQIRLPAPVRLTDFQQEVVEQRAVEELAMEQQDHAYFDKQREAFQSQQMQRFPLSDAPEEFAGDFANDRSIMMPMGPPVHVHQVIRPPARRHPSDRHSLEYSEGLVSQSIVSDPHVGVDGSVIVDDGTALQQGHLQQGHLQQGHGPNKHPHFFSVEANEERLPPPPIHGAHTKWDPKRLLPGPVQPSHANIPGARERAVWKQPYSYGYFGASGNRAWSKQYGYRDRSTQLRYR